MCDKWVDFIGFYEDMGDPGDGLSLDRIDNNRGYCKENCRWATRKEQCRNTRSNRLMSAFGESKTIAEWVVDIRCKVSRGSLTLRLSNGIHPEIALTTLPNPSYQRSQK